MAQDFASKTPEVATRANVGGASRKGFSLFNWGMNIRVVILILLVIGFIGFWLVSTIVATVAREVHVINGLPTDYRVRIDGKELALPTGTRQTVRVGEGEVVVEVLDNPGVPGGTFEIETPLFSRALGHHTFVINPDRCAVLLWEENVYSENPDPNAQMPYKVHVGKGFYHFEKIDYPFEEFPDEISISEGSEVKKRGLSFVDQFVGVPFNTWQVLAEEAGPDPARQYLADYLRCEPRAPQVEPLLMLLRGSCDNPQQMLDYARPMLDSQPVAIEWHRLYQELTEQLHPEASLAEEYEARLAKAPQDPALMYLLGRVSPYDRATELWHRAVAAPEPCAAAYGALAYRELSAGNWKEAAPLLDKALELDATGFRYQLWQTEVLLGSGRAAEVAAALAAEWAEEPGDVDTVSSLIRVYLAMGKEDAAQQSLAQFRKVAGQGDDVSPEEAAHNVALAEYALAYGSGDSAKAVEIARNLEAADLLFQAALLAGDLDLAKQQLESFGDGAGTPERLLVAALACHRRQNDYAAELVAAAAATLAGENRDSRTLGGWLTGAVTPTATDLERLPVDPGLKRIAVVVIGYRDPELRSSSFALARKLNVDLDPPHGFLAKLLQQPVPTATRGAGR